MISSWVNKLNESDSRLHKESVIAQALSMTILGDKHADSFLMLAKATYNPFVTFGIKQVSDTENITGAENPWLEFFVLLEKLKSRVLTGNAAKNAVEEISVRFDSVEWNTVCAPVIRRDLRAGVSEKTINKLCKKTKYEIPTFGCQLATNCEGRPEMSGVKRLEPKLDGVRVLMVVTNEATPTAISYSRNGKVFENFGHIEQQVQDNFNIIAFGGGKNFTNGFVLDGEVMSESFQALMRQARRKENVQAGDSVFHVFDIIPIDDFRRGHWNTPLRRRMEVLEKIKVHMDNVRLLPHITVDLDTASGKDQFRRYCNDKVAEGFEGVMIKDMESPYECKRNTFWLKYKPVLTVDLKVVAVEAGTGRNSSRMGALVCEGFEGDKFIQVNVGSGFSDEQRDEIWTNREVVLNQTVEVLCDVITQNQDGTYSLRFPRFVRFRTDK